jgi:GT2 family glycosyltransferase
MGRLSYAQNLSGVTAACVMVRKDVWDAVGGLDETFEVAFNDVDLCMRIRAAGYLIVWTPFAELYHYESKSRGLDEAPEKRKRFLGEVERFQTRWAKELAAGDPYYNPNFSLDKEDFSIKTL